MKAGFAKSLFTTSLSALTLLSSFSAYGQCKSDRLRISAGGDVIIHETSYQNAIRSPDRFYSLFGGLKPLVDVADISYLNLEGPVANGITVDKRDIGDQGFYYDCKRAFCGTNFLFNYHPFLIGDLQRLGIDIVSTANNHSLDRGIIGIDRSVEALQQYKMHFAGTRSSNGGVFHSITAAKGWKIAWIACTDALNGFTDKKDQVLACQEEETLNLIRRFSGDRTIDAVVVTPHWGPEYKQEPSSAQKKFAKSFAEAGATLIIGNHPHVVQRMNILKTESGRQVPVVYSLGNFLATQATIPKNLSAVFYFDLSKNRHGETVVESMSYVPTFMNAGSRNGSYVFTLSPIDRLKSLSYFQEVDGKVRAQVSSTTAGTSMLAQLLPQARQITSNKLPSRTDNNCR